MRGLFDVSDCLRAPFEELTAEVASAVDMSAIARNDEAVEPSAIALNDELGASAVASMARDCGRARALRSNGCCGCGGRE